MGQKASQSAPVAFLDLSGRSSQSVRPQECNHTAVAAFGDTSAVEGFLAVVYYHGLMRRRDPFCDMPL